MGKYIIRLDDAAENWNKKNWTRMHDLLEKYGVNPIIAIIPHNQDPKLLQFPVDEEFWDTLHKWVNNGWTPALHGYNHIIESPCGGINPANKRSEFAGIPLEVQKEKISTGFSILKKQGFHPNIFVAPAHTFDENTLLALKECTDIRIISDTVATDVYQNDGFTYIPQQSGQVRKLPFNVVTFCYHPNTMEDDGFEKLEQFILQYSDSFIEFSEIKLKRRNKNLIDKTLQKLYFIRRR